MPERPFALYNPALLPPDDLLAEFTARLPMLETLLGVVRGNLPGQPPQHCLLIGARGMGKTTTLWAIAHRVNRDAALSGQWQPVVFDEESRRVGDLADFWLECIRQWEHATRTPGGLADQLLEEASTDIEDRARDGFLQLVDRSGKRALLLIDNLNDVLSSIRDLEPLHRLRAFLMKDSRVMIVGGATRYFDEVTSVDQPFYDFFRNFELRPLTAEEMETCLLTQARNRGQTSIEQSLKERSGTVHALHLLTGGNPRLVKTFYRLLAEGLRGDIRAELERLMDEFTPYFKAIVDTLPVQQQRIFDAVALAWDPVEVATIATATRLPSNQVSAQLRTLVKAGLLREAAGGPKRKTYLLADRFSNIHYLMRHGRAARNRLDWFVALVRIVFPDQESTEILARAAREAAECGTEGCLDARSVLHSALTRTASGEDRRALMHAALRESWDSAAWNSLAEWIDVDRAQADLPEIGILGVFRHMPAGLRKQLGYQPESARWWFQLTDFLEEKESWLLAEAAYRKSIELDPKQAFPWIFLAHLLFMQLGRPGEAEVAFRKGIELDPQDAFSWTALGNLLFDYSTRLGEAEAAFRKAIELNPNDAYPWMSLGDLLLERLERPIEAEAAFRKGIELDPDHPYPWSRLGYLLASNLVRSVEAEAAFRKAVEIDPKYPYAWIGLGHLLAGNLSRPVEAEAAYRKAIELNPNDASSWSGLAGVLAAKGDAGDESRASATKALSLDPSYDFARAMFLRLCQDHVASWRMVLPSLVAWCVASPKADGVFDFTVEGFLRFARLTQPATALALIDSLPDVTPFQTVRDTFVAYGNRDHLLTLAPERQSVALALLDRISAPAASPNAAPRKTKRTRPPKAQ